MKTEMEFMKKLQQLLLWKYNMPEIKETIQAYERYFCTGKQVGKSEEKICKELGNPLAIVRELNIKRDTLKLSQRINHKATLRAMYLIIWLIILTGSTSTLGAGYPFIEWLVIINPLILVGGWYIVGKREFSRSFTEDIQDSYKAIKITMLHSIFLLMAILSSTLVARALTNIEVMYIIKNGVLVNLKVIISQYLEIFIIVAVLIMLLSIFEYRNHSREYYSLICHGTGFVATMLSYRQIVSCAQETERNLDIIFACEWVYIESLILASLFLVYCSWNSEKHIRK